MRLLLLSQKTSCSISVDYISASMMSTITTTTSITLSMPLPKAAPGTRSPRGFPQPQGNPRPPRERYMDMISISSRQILTRESTNYESVRPQTARAYSDAEETEGRAPRGRCDSMT